MKIMYFKIWWFYDLNYIQEPLTITSQCGNSNPVIQLTNGILNVEILSTHVTKWNSLSIGTPIEWYSANNFIIPKQSSITASYESQESCKTDVKFVFSEGNCATSGCENGVINLYPEDDSKMCWFGQADSLGATSVKINWNESSFIHFIKSDEIQCTNRFHLEFLP